MGRSSRHPLQHFPSLPASLLRSLEMQFLAHHWCQPGHHVAMLWPHPPSLNWCERGKYPLLNLRETNGGRHICWYLKKRKRGGKKSIYGKFQNKGSLFISEFTVMHVAFFWYLPHAWCRNSRMSGRWPPPPLVCRIISVPYLCLLEGWIQKLERERGLKLQWNNLMVCKEKEKHRLGSRFSFLEAHGICISNPTIIFKPAHFEPWATLVTFK